MATSPDHRPKTRAMAAYDSGEQAEHTIALTGSVDTSAVVPSDHSYPFSKAVLLTDIPQFEFRYTGAGGFDMGAYDFYSSSRKPEFQDETLARFTVNLDYMLKTLYDAFRTVPPRPVKLQREMITEFKQVMSEVEDPQLLLVQMSHILVKATIQLHVEGDHLRKDQVKRLQRTPEDVTMNSVERFECMVNILRRTKRVCLEVLDGKDIVTKFVAAPNAFEARVNRAFAKSMEESSA